MYYDEIYISAFKKARHTRPITWSILLCLILLLTNTLQLSAFTYLQTITLRAKNAKLATVLKDIKKQSGYNLFYDNILVSADLTVEEINVHAQHVAKVLDELLPPFNLEYKILDKNIILTKKSKSSSAPNATVQSKTVRGKVTNVDGEALVGVTVMEKGAATTSVTDDKGEYTIAVKSDESSLYFSAVGYTRKEISIGQKTTIDVVLMPLVQEMDEVVVVGYGQQKKVNLTGAVTSINYANQAESRPITSVSNALAGLIPGGLVQQNSGEPGNESASITIRGIGTLNSSVPLVLIDGAEGNMNNLNPQDVESISVLKDAASASIYGVRAANGVILVTTKKGGKGKASINYHGNFGYNEPTNLLNFISSYADYMGLINESRVNTGQASLFAQSTIDLWKEKSLNPNQINENGVPNYVSFPNTNWQDVIFNHGITKEHSISANGGSQLFKYYMSVGYLDNPGIVDNIGMKRYTFRSNIESDLYKWLTVGLRVHGNLQNKQPGTFGSMNSFISQISPGVYPEYNGKLGYAEAAEESGPTARNLLQRLNSQDGNIENATTNASFYSKVSFLKDFSWDFSLNYERSNRNQRTWTNSIDLVKLSNDLVILPGEDAANMTTYFRNLSYHNYTLDNLLRYTKTINNRHDISALLGYQEYYYYQFNNDATKKGLVDQSVNVPSSATIMQSINGDVTENASRSWFGRASYAYNNRYLFEANFRYDGSSRFYKDNRWGLFSSFSAGWIISEEGFMEGAKSWIDFLKVRVSWGKLGNNNVSDYPYQSTYSISNAVINSTLVAGLTPVNIPNNLLGWEKTTVSNLGWDMHFMDRRLQTEIDVYSKVTGGILFRPTIYLSLGNKTAPMMNIAEVQNKGVEISIKWQDRKGDFTYSFAGNAAYNNNKVTKYQGKYEAGWNINSAGVRVWDSNLGKVSTGDDMRIVEGKVVNEFYMNMPYNGTGTYYNTDGSININGGPKDGLIRTEEDMNWVKGMIGAGYTFMPYQTIAKNKIWYGDMLYADQNGDGYYGNTYDQSFQGGSNVPKINFGLQGYFSYKNYDLSMIWSGATGFYRYSTVYSKTSTGLGYAINSAVANDHYFYDPANPNDPRTNTTAKYGRMTNSDSYQNLARSSNYLFKGDYLKLKNLTVGYAAPKKFVNRFNVQNARIFVSGENLLNFNTFLGMDPELGASPTYTSVRTYALGLNVTF